MKVKPTDTNGVKFEMFIFDTYPLCNRNKFGLLEIKREDEFAALKNNVKDSQKDNEETARILLSR